MRESAVEIRDRCAYHPAVDRTARALAVAAATWLSIACSPVDAGEGPPAAALEADDDAPSAEQALEPEPPADDESLPEDEALPDDELVIEIDASDDDASRGGLPSTTVEPEPRTVAWTAVATTAPDLELVYLATGALARVDSRLFTIADDGTLISHGDLELPAKQVVGDWPDDAWAIESVLDTPAPDGTPQVAHRIWRYEDGQWAAKTYKRSERWVGSGLELRRSWHSGLMVRDGSQILRVDSKLGPPRVGPRMGKIVLAIVESRSGQLRTLSLRTTGVYAQIQCPDFDCVTANAVKLPVGSDWEFPMQVARGHDAITVYGRVADGRWTGHFLLHHGSRDWTLESLPAEPDGMWASEAGGLWVLVGDALWHRDPRGGWVSVALPTGVDDATAAMVDGGRSLWIAATVDGVGKLYTTAADPG